MQTIYILQLLWFEVFFGTQMTHWTTRLVGNQFKTKWHTRLELSKHGKMT